MSRFGGPDKVFINPGIVFKVESVLVNECTLNAVLSIVEAPVISDCLHTKDQLQALSRKPSMILLNTKYAGDDSRKGSLKRLEETFNASVLTMNYVTLFNALVSADFSDCDSTSDSDDVKQQKKREYANDLMSRCKETLSYLKRRGVLEKHNMSEEEAMAIIIFTFDYGVDKEKFNPYRKINTMLGTRNSSVAKCIPFLFHLLNALRKLEPCKENPVLYRGVKGINLSSYTEGTVRTWPAFTSTCADRDFAEDYAAGQSDVLFIIKGDFTGYEIQDFSIFNKEGKHITKTSIAIIVFL